MLVVESARPIGTAPSPSEGDPTLVLAEVAVPEEVPLRRPPRRGDALQVVTRYRGGGRLWAIALPPVDPAMVDVVLRTKDGWEATVTVPAVHADDARRIVLWFCTEPRIAGLFSARLAFQMGERLEVEVGAQSDDAAAGEGER